MNPFEHAPIGAKVRIITEGWAEHMHGFHIGQEGEVIGYDGKWAEVQVPHADIGDGHDTQSLDLWDYKVIQ